MPQKILIFLLLITGTFAFAQSQEPRLVLPVGHTINPQYACFSDNGKLVATTSLDNTCHIWDAGSGKLIQSLYGHKKGIDFAVFNSDNKRILTASRDNTAVLWDLETGSKIYELKDHVGWVSCADFSSDNKYVLTVSEDQIYVWDLKTGSRLKNAFDEDNKLRLEKWLMATEEDFPNSMLIKEQSSGFSINFTLGKVENEALSNIELKEIPTVYLENVLNKNTFLSFEKAQKKYAPKTPQTPRNGRVLCW